SLTVKSFMYAYAATLEPSLYPYKTEMIVDKEPEDSACVLHISSFTLIPSMQFLINNGNDFSITLKESFNHFIMTGANIPISGSDPSDSTTIDVSLPLTCAYT